MRGARILLGIAGGIAVLVSLAMMFATKAFLAPEGIVADDKIAVIGQAQASLLLGIGAVNLLGTRVSDKRGMQAILGGNLVTHVVALGVNLHALFGNLVTSQVWGDSVGHVVFAVLFAFFLWKGARS